MPLAKEVLIAVLNVNHSAFVGGTKVHLKSFRESLGLADGYLRGLATTTGALKIFVAPEYYFSQTVPMPRKHGDGFKTGYMPVSRDQAAEIVASLAQLSSQYSGFLIFAGSIHSMEDDGTGKKNTYNACPVLSGGDVVHLYYKRHYDNFATDVLTNPAFVAGTDSPLFAFGGLRFGVEICLDHGLRVLDNHLTSSGEAPPHIQVLVSRGMAIGKISATELAIQCEMAPGQREAGFVKRADGTKIDSIVTGRPISDGTYIECFRVPPSAGGALPLPFPTQGVGRVPQSTTSSSSTTGHRRGH